MPSGSGAAKGMFFNGSDVFVNGVAKRSLNESLHVWRSGLKRPQKLPMGPPAKYQVSGPTGRGWCGSLAMSSSMAGV